MEEKEIVLQVNQLSTSFRTDRGMLRAVQGVSFSVRRGFIDEFHGMPAPEGRGRPRELPLCFFELKNVMIRPYKNGVVGISDDGHYVSLSGTADPGA